MSTFHQNISTKICLAEDQLTQVTFNKFGHRKCIIAKYKFNEGVANFTRYFLASCSVDSRLWDHSSSIACLVLIRSFRGKVESIILWRPFAGTSGNLSLNGSVLFRKEATLQFTRHVIIREYILAG